MSLTVYGYKSSGGFSQVGFLTDTELGQGIGAFGQSVWLVKMGTQLRNLMSDATIALGVWDTDSVPSNLIVSTDRYGIPFSSDFFTTERALQRPQLIQGGWQTLVLGHVVKGTPSGDENDILVPFNGTGYQSYYRLDVSGLMDPFGPADVTNKFGMRVWVYGQVNRAPNTPTNVSPANGATITTGTPTIAGDFRDPDETLQDTNGATLFGVGSADKLAAYQIIIKQGGVTKWNSGAVSASGTEQTNRRFSRACPVTLPSGVYTLQTRVQDQAGAWSAYSSTTFTVSTAAVVLNGTPTGTITDLSPDFQFTFVTTTSDSANRAKVRLWKNGGMIGESPEITVSVPANTTGTIPYTSTGFADRAPGTDYEYQVQARYGASNLWTPWSELRAFRTNGAPNKPNVTWPAGDAFGRPAYPTIKATVTDDDDPDDQLTVETEVTRPDTTTIVLTNPTYNYQAKQWNQTTGATTIPAGVDGTYKVRVRGTDPKGAVGPWSDYATFQIGNFPAITNVTVTPNDGTNVTGAPVTFTWQTAGTSTPTASQQARRVITITNAATGVDVLVSDHTWQDTTYTTSNTVWEQNGTDYLYTIAVTDSLGLVGSYSGSFHVAYTPPAPITGVNVVPVGSDFDPAGEETMALIQWDAPATDPGAYIATDVKRQDGATWTLIGSIETQDQTAFLDPIPPLGSVAYSVTQRVQVNEAELSSDPAIAETMIAFTGMVLTDVGADASERITFIHWEDRSDETDPDTIFLPSWDGPPLAMQGAASATAVRVQATIPSDAYLTRRGLPSRAQQIAAFRALVPARRVGTGIAPRVLCYRDGDGRRLFGLLSGSPQVTDDPDFDVRRISFTLQQTSFVEGAA